MTNRVPDYDEPTKYLKRRGRRVRVRKFGIECRYGFRTGEKIQRRQGWCHWRWYEREKSRDDALAGLKNQAKGHILEMEYRKKDR